MPIIGYDETNLPTVSEIRETWCFGLPLNREDGVAMPDSDIQIYLDGAIKTVEQRLGIYLKPTVIASNPEERGLVEGTDYEKEEAPYDYSARDYSNWGFLQLRERPVQKLNGLKLVLPNGQIIMDFMVRPEWVKLYKDAGQLHIVPYAGDPTIFALLGGSQSGYPFVTGQINSNLPQMWYVDYIAGYAQNRVPEHVRNVVAKITAIDVLGIAGDALTAGVTSISTSIDGLSESVSNTASASSTVYGAHIAQFQKEVDSFFNPKEGGGRTSERGFTFIGL